MKKRKNRGELAGGWIKPISKLKVFGVIYIVLLINMVIQLIFF